MNKKLALYPMTREQCALVRYKALIQNYCLSHLFVPSFWMLHEKDVSCIDGGDFVGITVSNYSEDELAKVDVLFIDYDSRLTDLELYRKVIYASTEMNTEVIIPRYLAKLLNIEANHLVTIIENNYSQGFIQDKLFDILCPVITVISQGERTDQFVIELALREYFTNIGYSVSQIGSHDSSYFFSFANIPNFMYEKIEAEEKILRFNHFIKELVKLEQPELLIIGVPGAIMKHSNEVLQGLGVLPYIICNAVKSDLSILCMYYAPYKEMLFDEISKYSNYHLGCSINNFCMSGVRVSAIPSALTNNLEYYDMDSKFVLNGIKEEVECGDFHVFNALSRESVEITCDRIHAELSDNIHSMV